MTFDFTEPVLLNAKRTSLVASREKGRRSPFQRLFRRDAGPGFPPMTRWFAIQLVAPIPVVRSCYGVGGSRSQSRDAGGAIGSRFATITDVPLQSGDPVFAPGPEVLQRC